MKASRFVVVGIAAIAAILLALVVRGMIGGSNSADANAPQKVTADAPTVKVLVAARHLKVGERIAEADLSWKTWPQDGISEGYFTDKPVTPVAPIEAKSSEDKALEKNVQAGAAKVAEAADKALNPTRGMDAVLGGVVREEMLANEPIVARKVVRADAGGFMAVMLAPGMRAMAVPVTVESTAGGFILPGDRVDIVVSTEVQTNGQTSHVAKPVLRNVKVLAVDQTVEAKSDQPSVIGATATLEVRPDEGEALAQAKAQGPLSLMLRSYADAGGPSGRAGTASGAGNKVVVYRNGQGTDVPVTR
ncbi:Flp pilus assembly protein CpaB [Asticcacaulis sp. DW145]|uniref:Flp pilus assembly protein CpaB n=1 Tax=Asticcacaulis sp. DW145 TaxID=3095608 RepID=UPI003086F816|nr:Flp pilus assembly protein CpaB [Asticcacaulis sp. DW145]